MEEVFIVSGVRTLIGKFGGGLRHVSSSDLAATVIEAAIERAEVSKESLDEVIIGNVFQAGGKGNPARQAAIKAGIPTAVPAMTINKQCASGMRSVSLAYQQILANEAEIIVAGGTESMSNVPHLVLGARWGKKMGTLTTVDSLFYDGLECAMEGYHMGITGENLAEKYNITREEQDKFALNSQLKAKTAIEKGLFQEEIIPVKGLDGQPICKDENPQESSMKKLQKLKPAFKKNGTVTAGNASPLNDGASALVLVSGTKLKELGLKPLAALLPQQVLIHSLWGLDLYPQQK